MFGFQKSVQTLWSPLLHEKTKFESQIDWNANDEQSLKDNP
jgi:hypothetical protein